MFYLFLFIGHPFFWFSLFQTLSTIFSSLLVLFGYFKTFSPPGSTTIDGDFTLATIADTSDSSSTTEKKSKLTIPANNPIFNDELKCVATWTGADSKEIMSTSDVNAIGASMAAQTFSDGATGDGVISCVVWGDSPPHSVSWKNPKEETVSNVANEVSNLHFIKI